MLDSTRLFQNETFRAHSKCSARLTSTAVPTILGSFSCPPVCSGFYTNSQNQVFIKNVNPGQEPLSDLVFMQGSMATASTRPSTRTAVLRKTTQQSCAKIIEGLFILLFLQASTAMARTKPLTSQAVLGRNTVRASAQVWNPSC